MIERASSAECCGSSVWLENRYHLAVDLDRRRKIGGDEEIGAVSSASSDAAVRA
jgi:hypothetical protein